jgi:hypothetical protein
MQLRSSRNFFATRHFYFGKVSEARHSDRACFTFGVECPWHLRKRGALLVGFEDYYEKAGGDADLSREPGDPSGNVQDQLLMELLGELRNGEVINTGPGLIVEAVKLQAWGGIRISLSQRHVLEIFPASARAMEWIFMQPGRASLVFMNGVINKTRRKH